MPTQRVVQANFEGQENNTTSENLVIPLVKFLLKMSNERLFRHQNLSTIHPTLYGWKKDECNKALVPVGIPEGVLSAPTEVLNR